MSGRLLGDGVANATSDHTPPSDLAIAYAAWRDEHAKLLARANKADREIHRLRDTNERHQHDAEDAIARLKSAEAKAVAHDAAMRELVAQLALSQAAPSPLHEEKHRNQLAASHSRACELERSLDKMCAERDALRQRVDAAPELPELVVELQRQLSAAKKAARLAEHESAPAKAEAELWKRKHHELREQLGKSEVDRQRERSEFLQKLSACAQKLQLAKEQLTKEQLAKGQLAEQLASARRASSSKRGRTF
jgi:hypothetical protein